MALFFRGGGEILTTQRITYLVDMRTTLGRGRESREHIGQNGTYSFKSISAVDLNWV